MYALTVMLELLDQRQRIDTTRATRAWMPRVKKEYKLERDQRN